MSYLYAPVVGLLIGLLNLVCWLLVLLALPTIKWDKEPTADHQGVGSVIRGDLPRWLSWFSTPDERLPGAMYEPTVAAMHAKWGKWVTSWYWLGFRNCLMGLAVQLGKTTTDYIPEEPLGFWERGDVWRYSKVLTLWKLPLKFVIGWQVYKTLNGTFQAAPVFTLKRF